MSQINQNMIKIHLKISFFILMILGQIGYAQYGTQKKADHLFNVFTFADAAKTYKKLIDNSYNADYNTRQLADCYAFMRNPDSAAVYYEKVITQKNVPIAYYYNYAQALRGIKKYRGYRKWMRKFKKAGGFVDDEKLSQDKDFLNVIFNAKQQYFLLPVGFNSKYSDFGAIQNHGKIYFASSRDRGTATKHVYGWNNEPFLDMYIADDNSEINIDYHNKVKGDVNTVFHDGPATITQDGKTMYFSRDDFNNQVLGQDAEGITHLKIYKATLVDDKWTNIVELPFNNTNYSCSHPALNADDSKLYFASDGPNSFGGTDIFYVDINADGSYGIPQNLGSVVNTPKNERFPFVNSDGVLFFASDGHPGLGLLDIFGTVLDKNKQITDVFNLGVPVNSSNDDFSFYMSPDGLSGYFSSNRDGGVGSDDIYAYKRIPPLELDGFVTDSKGMPLANTEIGIFDDKNEELSRVITDDSGNFAVNIYRDAYYKIMAKKDSYE